MAELAESGDSVGTSACPGMGRMVVAKRSSWCRAGGRVALRCTVAEGMDPLLLTGWRKGTKRIPGKGRFACPRAGCSEEAAEILQAVLDLPEERFVLVPRAGADDKETRAWSGARLEAGTLLRGLPPKGREAYERLSGDRARELLDDAVKGKDAAKLEEE